MKTILLICFLFFGCGNPREDLTNYKCSSAQLDILERQSKICSTRSAGMGFNDSYCFAISMRSSCEYTGDK